MSKGLVINFHNETDPVIFEQTLLALKSWYRIVPFDEFAAIVKSNGSTHNLCHITFDDGEIGFYQLIFPLLKKHNVPVSLFVSPEIVATEANFWFQRIEGASPETLKSILSEHTGVQIENLRPFDHMSIFKCLSMKEILNVVSDYELKMKPERQERMNVNLQELTEMEASNLVCAGAHTLRHPILTNEDDTACEDEIGGSIKQLAGLLGHSVKSFAYPNGRPGLDFGKREQNMLGKYGVEIAFSTQLDRLETKDLLALPRMGFARMKLRPANPLIRLRLSLGKSWPQISSIGNPSEADIRRRITDLMKNAHKLRA